MNVLKFDDVRTLLLSPQVPVWPMAGERRGRRQLGEGSHRPAGVTRRGRGRGKVDGDASGAGLSLSECAGRAGIAWQPNQYVVTKNTFFGTMVDLLVGTIKDSAPGSPFCLARAHFPLRKSSIILVFPLVTSLCFILSGILSAEVHEDMREAANNLVKHFHKPEQEVCVTTFIVLTCWRNKQKMIIIIIIIK